MSPHLAWGSKVTAKRVDSTRRHGPGSTNVIHSPSTNTTARHRQVSAQVDDSLDDTSGIVAFDVENEFVAEENHV